MSSDTGIKRIAILSIMHCMIDFLCAFAVYGIFRNPEDLFSVYLTYNFFAFALQMPLGIILDRLRQKRPASFSKSAPVCFTAAGIVLTLAGLFSHPAVLGLGNALFHTGGGVISIEEDDRHGYRGRGLGVFVAPGAIGLFLGAWVTGMSRLIIAGCAGALLAVLSVLLLRTSVPEEPLAAAAPSLSEDAVQTGVACLLVVILRGWIGLSVSMPWKTGFLTGLSAVLALASGKTAGGFLAADFGMKKTSVVSLAAAAVCYLFRASLPFGLLALFTFNMTMPITLYLLAKKMKGMEGFAFGLLTFGLFVGFVLTHQKALVLPELGTAGSLLSMALLAFCLKEEK